ncbi:hypothetical protein Tco_1354993 [Tanacetum coccineum]
MSANDKFGLGYGDHKYDGILSYENEVLQSVFMSKESDLENQPLYDRDCDFHEKRLARKAELTNGFPHRALKNKGIVDSGCSRHMTGNKAYLAEFQDFNGGPVAFGGDKREYSIEEPPKQYGVAERKEQDLIEVRFRDIKLHPCRSTRSNHHAGTKTLLMQGILRNTRIESAQECFGIAIWLIILQKDTPGLKTQGEKKLMRKLKLSGRSLHKKLRTWLSVSTPAKASNTVDHMEIENAQSEGRTKEMVDEDKEIDERILSTEDVLSTDKEGVSTDFEKVSTDRPIVSTDGSKVSTDRQIEGTDEQVEGTEEHNEGTEEKNEGTEEIFEGTEEQREGTEEKVESTDGQIKGTEDQTEEEIATQATQTSTQTPTSMIFGDDETIAKVLLNMSQAKAVSKEKEKGVELKDVEETDRPRPTSTRSLLTLKPLPKIDPKDKGKKKIEEEDESESESDGIPQAEKKFKQLESDEELARKVQEEWEAEEERNRIAEENAANEDLIRDFDDIKARIEADRLLAEKLQAL